MAAVSVPVRGGDAAVNGQRLGILVLCEDEFAWRRASFIQAHLQRELRSPYLYFSCWRFRWLHHPKMLQLAAAVAAAVDVMLVFRSSNQLPPTTLRQCVRTWLEGRGSRRVGLFAIQAADMAGRRPTRWRFSWPNPARKGKVDLDADFRLISGSRE